MERQRQSERDENIKLARKEKREVEREIGEGGREIKREKER